MITETRSTLPFSKNRKFLEFAYRSDYDAFEITADFSGGFAFLQNILRKDALPLLTQHFEIVDNIEMSEDQKLSALSILWRDISPKVGGYLFGDMSENNK
jgi:hypothetical protein